MGRSIVNLAGLAAVLLCAASVAMWLWSQYADDAWVLPARPLTNPPPSYGQAAWELNRVVGSTNGRLVCLEYEEPQYSPYKWSEGYCPPPVPQRILDKSTYLAPPYPAGMERGALPGVEWVSMPYQVVHQRYQTIGRRRYVSVSWLVPAAVGLPVLPAAFAWRRVWRRVKARRLNLCVNSGYDLRASPGRCPECGEKGDRIRDPKSAARVAGSARSEQVLARLRVRSGWVWLGEGSPKMALTRFVPLQPASGLGGAWGGGG